MGLESVTFISDLVPTWPLGADKIRQGDDHLRAIKTAIKNTFPNIAGAVTLTHTQLNTLPNDFSAVLTEILKHVVPKGTIVMWSGSVASIPTGWALCNGQNVSGYGVVPDLRGRFVLGAGGAYNPADQGGAASVTSGGGGNHTPVIQSTVLTISQIPAHKHQLYVWNVAGSNSTLDGFAGGNVSIAGEIAGGGALTYVNGSNVELVGTEGGGQGHTHAADAVPDHTHTVATMPPYYALAYIIKTGEYVAP